MSVVIGDSVEQRSTTSQMLVLLLFGLGLIPISFWKLWAAALRGKGWKLTAK